MDITIKFSKKNSLAWIDNFEFNKHFVQSTIKYLMDLYHVQGYIYLNKIYESLSVAWNPHHENICWIEEENGELKFSVNCTDESCEQIVISITSI